MDAPGLFYYLVESSVLTLADLEPLLAILPAERFVLTNLRGGEAFDSLRWPVAHDAELATIAARCLDEPALNQAIHTIEQARRDRTRLRDLARASTAQCLAAMGGDADLLRMLWPDATLEDFALFSAPLLPIETAHLIQYLCHAHYQAADGLYAFHTSRGIPGPSAPPAASIVERAIKAGKLHPDELIALAIGMVQKMARRDL